MKLFKSRLFAFNLIALMLSLPAVTGCSGGWGEARPAITAVTGAVVNVGQKDTLTVAATGIGPFTYQWYVNGVLIAGATSSTYSMQVTAGDNGSVYTVAVTNAAGTTMSAPYTLTVGIGPSISVQPASQVVAAGAAATFTVTASGSAPLTYQWYENGTAISGATNSTYTTPSSAVTTNGSQFNVTVANSVGQITSSTATLSVTPLPSGLAFSPIPSKTYGDAAFSVSASSSSPGAITYAVGSGPATVSGSVVSIQGTGTVFLTASQAAAGNYVAATAITTFNVGLATPTLSFTPIANQTYGATVTAAATSVSPGAITYKVSPSSIASISGSTITTNGVGTVTVTATQAATADYAAAIATTTFNVGQATPTLSFTPIANQTYGGTATAAATSTSPGAITYTVSPSSIASISGSTITTTGVGTVTVTATQAATADYAAATATTTFNVGQATPTLSFTHITNQTYGATVTAAATSASPGAITYTVSPSGIASINGSTITTTGVGTVTVTATQAATADYAAAIATTTFNVGQATPTLSFTPIAGQTYGATATAAATSASPGAITYTVSPSSIASISGSTITTTGVGTVTVTASQAATADYAAATAITTFTVGQATPTLSFTPIPGQTYGATATAAATSASTGAITYTVSPSSIASISGSTITTTGVGTVTVTASQAATADYAAATATTTFNVGQATPTLSFHSIAQHTYGDAAFTVSASSASSGTVTYTVTGGPATISGNLVTITGPGTVMLAAAEAATSNYTAATASTSFVVASNVTISAITPGAETIAPQNVAFTATATGGVTDNVTWTATGGTFNGAVWTAPDTSGTYTITATSVDEPSVSVSSSITIAKPVITAQPVSTNACVGYNPSLAMAAQYATSYTWSYNGSTLVNNSPTLSFNNVTTSSSGAYSCTAINDAGFATTNTVSLNVVSPTTLAITSQPSSVSVYATQTATFSVGANGTGALKYQWYTGSVGSGTAIAGATSSTYTTGALTAANNGTQYYVTVTDPNCTNTTLTSAAATLAVSTADTAVPPTIVVQPVGETASVGGSATFSVTASGSGTLTYQWYRVPYSSTPLSNPVAGLAVAGATSRTYTVPATATAQSNDGDNYFVVVTNAYGSASSSRVVLAVGAGIVLQLTDEPQAQYIAADTLASFSVTATCTGCTAGYQWYWYAPGSTTAAALVNGAVSSGALSGATVSGATTSSLTLSNVPVSASAGTFYVVVKSTDDGTTQISGTNPLTSATAGLFVGSLGTVGNTAAGSGLCNSASANWVLNGTNPGTASTDVPYQNTSACTSQLTNDLGSEKAAVYWPTLISTAKFSVSFTVAMAATSTPADGFTMVLADPSQGATTSTIGAQGEGLGANGIPGFVLGFDTYQNGDDETTPNCTTSQSTLPCDPVTVPYMAVGQGAPALWERPWTFVNGNLNTQASSNYSASTFANATHSYVVTVVNHVMTVTMDGYELFTGTVSLPPAAYLGFTASTGGSKETVIFSNLTATVSAP